MALVMSWAVLFTSSGAASGDAEAKRTRAAQPRGCPAEMARVQAFCIDRWEISVIDAVSGRPLSPYYPPQRGAMNRVLDVWQIEREVWGTEAARDFLLPELSRFQREERFDAKAVSRPNVIPQAYLSRELARRACELAGKRLCSHSEWQTACRGERGTQFPYGSEYVPGHCNVWRNVHPARSLHGSFSLGHLDPRLNLVVEFEGEPLLRETGTTPTCQSRFGADAVYDMVGNLDEWVEDEPGIFAGGFYARPTSKGCEAKVSSHAPTYFDYSTGTRCCRNARD